MRQEGLRRVTDFLEVARRVVAQSNAWIPEVAKTTGLSVAGVEWAVRECLELHPTAADLERLVTSAETSEETTVVLSSNVFVGVLRAIACALAASPVVNVKLSRRDSVLARMLVAQSSSIGVQEVSREVVYATRRGTVHVYGRAATIESIRKQVAPQVAVLAHGPGLGIVYLAQEEVRADVARHVVEDASLFDQRGCLSPRIVFCEAIPDRARQFAEALQDAFVEIEESMPMGTLAPDEMAAKREYLEVAAMASELVSAREHHVSCSPVLRIPPAGRLLHVVSVQNTDEARALLAPIQALVTIVGAYNPQVLVNLGIQGRVARPGNMQSPPLDGPVDLRSLSLG